MASRRAVRGFGAPRRCSNCGGMTEWNDMQYIGHQVFDPYPPENDPGEVLEMRNCACGSTLTEPAPFTALDVERVTKDELERGANSLKEARQRAIQRLAQRR